MILGSRIYACNVGDSRCVMCRGTEALPLSVDHKPNAEKEFKRITEAGGVVFSRLVSAHRRLQKASAVLCGLNEGRGGGGEVPVCI